MIEATMSEKKGSVEITASPDAVMEAAQKETVTVPSGGPTDSGRSAIRQTGSDLQHALTSTKRGESTIEALAKKVETRRANRIPLTFPIRKRFLEICRDAAKEEGQVNKLSGAALESLRDQYKEKVQGRQNNALLETKNSTAKLFGFWDDEIAMLEVFEAAWTAFDEVDGDWFFFRDFNYYNTTLAPRVQLFSSPVMAASVYLLMFYLGSAILFCPIMKDDVVCPDRDSYDGWLTSVYFASVTMSTVGYGDVNLSGGEKWRTFIGTIYMLVAMGFAYTVFSTAADAALSAAKIDGDTSEGPSTIFQRLFGIYSDDHSLPLYKRVRRLAYSRIFELTFWFVCLNLFGIFVARAFVNASDVEVEQWDWMTTFYWAIQTTTTIGYGDLDMPFEMRWFQIFFTTFGTAFVGAVFGAAAGIKDEVMDMRRFYAWKRREVSKQLIDDMQGSDPDEKVDQYEFMVASLLMLNKINGTDVGKIMDKYRELAGDKGYILVEDLNAERDDHDDTAEEEIQIDG